MPKGINRWCTRRPRSAPSSLPTLARTSSTIHYLAPAGGLTRGRAPTLPVAPDGFGRQPWRPAVCRRRPAGTRGAWRKVSLSEGPSDTPVADRGAVAWHCQIPPSNCDRLWSAERGIDASPAARAPQAFGDVCTSSCQAPSGAAGFCAADRPAASEASEPAVRATRVLPADRPAASEAPEPAVRGFARSAPTRCFPVDGVGAPITWPSA